MRYESTRKNCQTRHSRLRPPNARRGFTVVESIASIAILSLLIAMAAQMSAVVLKTQRQNQRQREATMAKNNLMHFAMARPYEELNQERLMQHAEGLALASSEWEIGIEELDEPKRKCISLSLTFDSPTQVKAAPLVAWKYPDVPRTGDSP